MLTSSNTHRGFKFLALTVAIIFAITLLGFSTSARADGSGPVNPVTWANSWGSINVYCVDQAGNVSAHHQGGFRVYQVDGGGNSTLSLFVSHANILSAAAQAKKTNKPVLIKATTTTGLYSIYVEVETDPSMTEYKFLIFSKPDAEGKTLLGWWHDCQPGQSEQVEQQPTEELCWYAPKEIYIPCSEIPQIPQ